MKLLPGELLIADHALNVLHAAIVLLLVFGWMSLRTRRLHRFAVCVVAFCWIAIGGYFGRMGYCPLTDWHWQVKRLRGEKNLTPSYIDYHLRKIGLYFDPNLVDLGVMIIFGVIALITLYFWWKERREAAPQL